MNLVGALQLFRVVVLDAERAADFFDHVLIRRRLVAARGFFAARVGLVPVGIDVAAGQHRCRLRCARGDSGRYISCPDSARDASARSPTGTARRSAPSASARRRRSRCSAAGVGPGEFRALSRSLGRLAAYRAASCRCAGFGEWLPGARLPLFGALARRSRRRVAVARPRASGVGRALVLLPRERALRLAITRPFRRSEP